MMNNHYDMTRNPKANQLAYDFWRDRVRERVKDKKKAELLAPTERPHLFGGKRLSLEQDFYDSFDKVCSSSYLCALVSITDVDNSPTLTWSTSELIRSRNLSLTALSKKMVHFINWTSSPWQPGLTPSPEVLRI